MSETEDAQVLDHGPLSTQASRVLKALQDGGDDFVKREEFVRVMYPDPELCPATGDVVFREIIRQLRLKGYSIETKRGVGYRLTKPDQ